jgi:hypothetical protein
MTFSDLPPEEEMKWEDRAIIGLALRMRIYHDSEGNVIRPNDYYQVGYHEKSGKFIIVPEGVLLDLIKQRALSSILNQTLNEGGRLN